MLGGQFRVYEIYLFVYFRCVVFRKVDSWYTLEVSFQQNWFLIYFRGVIF